MSQFLAPLNYDRARDVLRRLSGYTAYTPEGAQQAAHVLRQCYPTVFQRMEQKTFSNGAILLELSGGTNAPLVFVSHLDAQAAPEAAACEHEQPMGVPLSRAHLVALLEALEALLNEGYLPGGDLLLATCRKVLDEEYPEYADKIQLTLPDEKFRRVGQSMAAASLPEMK